MMQIVDPISVAGVEYLVILAKLFELSPFVGWTSAVLNWRCIEKSQDELGRNRRNILLQQNRLKVSCNKINISSTL